MAKDITSKEIWDDVFNLFYSECKKIIDNYELLEIDGCQIVEDQLKPIIWHIFHKNKILSITEAKYNKLDMKDNKKRLDMKVITPSHKICCIEIKRNLLRLRKYTSAIEKYGTDIDKLNKAYKHIIKQKHACSRIFIEILFFNRNIDKITYIRYARKLFDFYNKYILEHFEWPILNHYRFGGKEFIIQNNKKETICLEMSLWISD